MCLTLKLALNLTAAYRQQHDSHSHWKIWSAFLCIQDIHGPDGEGFPFCPTPSHPHHHLPEGTVWPIQAPNWKDHTASFACTTPCTPLYLSLLAHHCPLNLFYVITWHQSYLLTLIRGKIEPIYFLNTAYFMYTSTWIYKLPIQLYLTYVKLIVSALSEVEITLKLDVCGFHYLLDLNKARTTHNLSMSHRKAFHWGRDSEVDFWQGTSYFWCSPVCTCGCMHVLQYYFCVCGLRWCDDESAPDFSLPNVSVQKCKSWVFRADSALNKVSVALNI